MTQGTQEGLELYGIFLEMLKKWELDKDLMKYKPSKTPFTDFLMDQLTCLEKIEKGEKVGDKELQLLKRFFWDLGEEFRKEIMKGHYEQDAINPHDYGIIQNQDGTSSLILGR